MENASSQPLTKHERILRYIESLKAGSKISVRKISKELEVSEGTAYRAIKEAENLGLVSTRERIGTVRVEKKQRNNIDKLTFAEVVNIVDGHVLGGKKGLDKTLNKFVIGAMQLNDMMRYVGSGNLLIVGNRTVAHKKALEHGAGVLITGGFDTTDEVKQLADKLDLPVISCSYDTFTVASMINRAIYDRLIKKKILLVEDIISTDETKIYRLKCGDTVEEWKKLAEKTGHSRFPVVDEKNRVIGMLTSKDVLGSPLTQPVEKLMTKNPLTVTPQTSIASASHMMVWEGIEILPVVDNNRRLIGIISRQDVLKAMQYIQKQPQMGETLEDLIWAGFEEHRNEEGQIVFRGIVTPQMSNYLGMISEGVLSTLMMKAAYHVIRQYKKGDFVLKNMASFFIKPLQIEAPIEIRHRIIELSRKFGKVDVEVFHEEHLICKAMMTCQDIDQD